jgi:hypothetical protein
MNEQTAAVIRQIRERGGNQTAEMLNRLLEEIRHELGRDFNVKDFFDHLLHRYGGFEDRYRMREEEEHPMEVWRTTDQGEVINVIPSAHTTSICAPFCLTIAGEGFTRMHPPRHIHRRMHLNFYHSILKVSAYWLGCLSVNKETLILTPNWDATEFEKHYENLIANYVQVHHKKVFIVEVSKSGFIQRYPY